MGIPVRFCFLAFAASLLLAACSTLQPDQCTAPTDREAKITKKAWM